VNNDLSFRLAQALHRVSVWHDLTGPEVDPKATEVLVGGLNCMEEEHLFALAAYPDGEQVLCFRQPEGRWGRVMVTAEHLATLRAQVKVSEE
jgi:hypothetical protein